MSAESYRNKVRVRANGLLIQDTSILLVQIQSPVSGKRVWMPPGGGLEFGELMENCLEREFREETGLHIQVGELQFINELIEPPFHAVELYYKVTQTGGRLKLGRDPEYGPSSQILKDIKWIPFSVISEMSISPRKLKNYIADLVP